jgi:hypothetical protein
MLDLSKLVLISIIISNISNLTCYIYIYIYIDIDIDIDIDILERRRKPVCEIK